VRLLYFRTQKDQQGQIFLCFLRFQVLSECAVFQGYRIDVFVCDWAVFNLYALVSLLSGGRKVSIWDLQKKGSPAQARPPALDDRFRNLREMQGAG
jgi:hypothetical protein